jgi:hypothetical protein
MKWRAKVSMILFMLAVAADPMAAQGPGSVRDAARELLGAGFIESDIDSVATVLALQIATFPVGTSSGGFTLRRPTEAEQRDRGLKNDEYVLKRKSLGPFFAERASTLGVRWAYTFGINAQSTRFAEFEGRGLRNGDLASTIVVDGALRNLNRYTFDVSTQTTTVLANVGVHSSVDVGIIVPVVRTSLSGTSSSLLPTGQLVERVVQASSVGIGDVIVRGKWNFHDHPPSAVAAQIDVSFPTGDEDRLTTTGQVRVRPMLVASAEFGEAAGFSPHLNVGYTFGGSGVTVRDRAPFLPEIVSAEVGSEFNYVVGAEAWPSPLLTVYVDLVGRVLRDVARFDAGRRIVEVPNFGPLDVGALVAREGSLNVRLGSVGARAQVLGKGIISASLLFPLNAGGVKPGVTPVIGFEYTFGASFETDPK